jgi:alcohol dehydrogenase (cytochrome c)
MQRIHHRPMSAVVLALLAAVSLTINAAPVRKAVEEEKKPEAAAHDPNEPVKVHPELVKAGAEQYKMYCVRCHGVEMVTQGSGSFALRTFPLDEKSRFIESVTQGKRSMPAWGAVLKQRDLEALWQYVANHQLSQGNVTK